MKHLLILSLFWISLALSEDNASPQELSATMKKSNQLLDPFNRGVTRPSQFDSTGIKDGSSNRGRFDDMRSLNYHRYYRVVSLDETNLFDPALNDTTGIQTEGAYDAYFVTLRNSNDKNSLLQYGKKIMLGYREFLTRDLSIKSSGQSPEGFLLTYGPFKTLDLARAHCHFFTYATNSYEIDCNKSLTEKPTGGDSIDTADAEATLGLSQAGILYFSKSEMYFKINDLISMNLIINVYQPLGPEGYFVTKINAYGVYAASVNGDVTLIPMNSLPINDQIEDVLSPGTANSSTNSAGETASAKKTITEEALKDQIHKLGITPTNVTP